MSEDRALTTKQPWASLCVTPDPEGPSRPIKPVENRSWPVPSTLPQWTKCSGCAMRWAPGDGPPFSYEHWHGSKRGWMERSHDGPFPFRLWIHAGKGWDNEAEDGGLISRAIRWVKARLGFPRSVLLGSVLVTGCHHADECEQERGDTAAYFYCSPWAQGGDNVYHWTLADPQPLPEPIPMKGRQGLWRVPHSSGGFLVGSSSPSTPSTSTD